MFEIRDGVKEDCVAIEAMIKELAVYENMPNEPAIGRQILEREAFGGQPLLRTMVAEDKSTKQLIAYALYFFKYSTYTGKSLYLEDLYVKPNYRQVGVGGLLLTAVTKQAALHLCQYAEWSCLDWNQNSINFYNKFGAKERPESKGWLSFKLDKQQIESVINESDKNND